MGLSSKLFLLAADDTLDDGSAPHPDWEDEAARRRLEDGEAGALRRDHVDAERAPLLPVAARLADHLCRTRDPRTRERFSAPCRGRGGRPWRC